MAREIEVKLLADGSSYEEVVSAVTNAVLTIASSMEHGTSVDCYWTPPSGSEASAIRLRANGHEADFTVKVEDQKNTTDRREWVIPISTSKIDDMTEAMNAALGEPVPIMWRWTDFQVKECQVSVIQNIERREYTFIEVEGPNLYQVQKWVDTLKETCALDLKQVKNSFYSIFAKKQGVML